MKGFFASILLLTIVLRPMYNVGYLAYYELNIDYIIETYCVNKEKPEFQCNGKCHLASKLNNGPIDKKDSSASILDSIFEVFIPVYFHDNKIHLGLEIFTTSFENNWSYSNTFSSFNIDKLSPPPWV